MNDPDESEVPSAHALELFKAHPDVLYSLDATAHLARVSRRAVLIYCRAGLVRPVFQPPYGVMVFTEEAIYTVRRIEDVRVAHGIGMASIKSMLEFADDVERLRAEIRFLRAR
jgi:DNA-binding transcriptional MerR regulator